MTFFILGVALLILGYFTYGRFVERILAPDDRETPAVAKRDGVDFLVLPHWKNMLIQLLNIAGVGPVIGVIAGIRFGSIVFLLIPIGNIIGGAVHDFISGMASLRNGGANLPSFIKSNLGGPLSYAFAAFMIFLLLLVVAVFINTPAGLIAHSFFGGKGFWLIVCAIFVYYIAATLFPVDKIIGKFYPFFGAALILGSVALFFSLVYNSAQTPELLSESEQFAEKCQEFRVKNPLLPCLFVTIACGILSGFHATQSPIIARTMKSEREARSSFYGMMVVEGIIAMIWAGAALALFNKNIDFFWLKPDKSLVEITRTFLGSLIGNVTVIAVVVLAVTSGDTAMRSMRLSLAEMLKIDQKPFANRILLCVPLIAIIGALLWWSNQNEQSFLYLWNYFAWANQVLAVFTLGSGTVWLYSQRKQGWISVLPGAFMTFIVVTFILWTGGENGGPRGFGLDLQVSRWAGIAVAILFNGWCIFRGIARAKEIERDPTLLESRSDSSVR